jgi:hypothetical protein
MVERPHVNGIVFAIVGELRGNYKAHGSIVSLPMLFANGERQGNDDGGEPKKRGRLAEKH